MVQYFPVITGSLVVQGSVLITGSINTTAGITGSFSGTATTAQTASSVANLNQNVQITGSLTTSGTITAQTLNVQQVTSSIVFSSGSNVFGNSLSNTQVMTGSVLVTGSIGVATNPVYALDILSAASSSANIQAQFYNSDYGSGVRNFIRVRNGISIGSTFSSYFGQGQDGKTYIIANDLSRNDFVINGNNGYVGLGTSSPTSLLTLAKDNNIGINTVDGSDNGYLALSGAGADGENRGGHIYLSGNERGADAGTTILAAGNIPSGSIQFRTGASVERMRINTTGYVGIGTNNPVVPLHVAGTNGVLRIGNVSNNARHGNDGGGSYIEQYGTTQATSVFRIQSSKAGNETDYTTVTIDPYSGLNVTKSGTGATNVFASGVPIQVVYGAAIASSGPQGTGVSLGTACNGDTPSATQGIQIASVSFTPKKANSLILIQTNSVAMWERTNLSDHFYLWAANTTDGTILVKAGQYLQNFGSGGQNGGIICLQGITTSWGTDAKTISFRIGSTGGGANYEYNPYYNVSGFSNATVGNFTYVITEIGQ